MHLGGFSLISTQDVTQDGNVFSFWSKVATKDEDVDNVYKIDLAVDHDRFSDAGPLKCFHGSTLGKQRPTVCGRHTTSTPHLSAIGSIDGVVHTKESVFLGPVTRLGISGIGGEGQLIAAGSRFVFRKAHHAALFMPARCWPGGAMKSHKDANQIFAGSGCIRPADQTGLVSFVSVFHKPLHMRAISRWSGDRHVPFSRPRSHCSSR